MRGNLSEEWAGAGVREGDGKRRGVGGCGPLLINEPVYV